MTAEMLSIEDVFTASGVGNLVFIDGNMTRETYRTILHNNLLQSVDKLKMDNEWTFQHDNDPKHRAAIVNNWLNRNGIKRLEWPSFSPDLNTCGMRSNDG